MALLRGKSTVARKCWWNPFSQYWLVASQYCKNNFKPRFYEGFLILTYWLPLLVPLLRPMGRVNEIVLSYHNAQFLSQCSRESACRTIFVNDRFQNGLGYAPYAFYYQQKCLGQDSNPRPTNLEKESLPCYKGSLQQMNGKSLNVTDPTSCVTKEPKQTSHITNIRLLCQVHQNRHYLKRLV